MCFAPQRHATFSTSQMCTLQPAALASLLFDLLEPQIIGKTQCFATFLPFRAPASSFFWLFLFSDLLSSALLFSILLLHLCFSSVHIVGSLTSKIPSNIFGKWSSTINLGSTYPKCWIFFGETSINGLDLNFGAKNRNDREIGSLHIISIFLIALHFFKTWDPVLPKLWGSHTFFLCKVKGKIGTRNNQKNWPNLDITKDLARPDSPVFHPFWQTHVHASLPVNPYV